MPKKYSISTQSYLYCANPRFQLKLIALLTLHLHFRYFVTEVLETIAPPYSQEFVSLFLPLVENEEITGSMRVDMDSDPVSEFIVHCKATHGTNHIA